MLKLEKVTGGYANISVLKDVTKIQLAIVRRLVIFLKRQASMKN